MDILPGDLGARRMVALAAERAARNFQTNRRGPGPGSTPVNRIGFLGRYWLQGIDCDDATGRHLLGVLRPLSMGLVGGLGGGFGGGFGGPAFAMFMVGQRPLAMVFGLLGTCGVLAGIAAPGIALRRWVGDAVSADEIDSLLDAATDPLERAYLALVGDALRQEQMEGGAADELREAIRALGDAIDRLPPATTETAGREPVALRIDAENARRRAAAEADPVVAESLERRAEALERSAAALEQSAIVLRRAAALREELAAQTDALRLGLTAHFQGGAETAHLSQLAASARGVAREAGSLAAARAELDAEAPAPPLQRLGG